MEKEKLKNIEFVIGIDLGHGETSAAFCPVQWDTPEGQLEPVTDLDMGSNRKVIPSAITIMKNGDAYIGESAFNSEHLQNADKSYLCFKKMPEDINGEQEKIMIRFMREVYNLIREKNSANLRDGNHIVAIATPSGWPQSAMNLYKKMAKEAGIPIEFVTRESRAAFLRAQHKTDSGLSRNIDKGAIVFDMGSSTLDFTFMSTNNSGSYLDYGYDCGASMVEKIMYNQMASTNEIVGKFEEKYPNLTAVLLKKVREVKEKIYFEPESKLKKIVNFDELIEDDDFEDERVKITYEPGELNELLKKEGYIQKIKDAMMDFKFNHIQEAKIYGVLLTGGASRMDFIKDLVKECWGVDDSQIYKDQDPSLTISQGVAEAARVDLLTNGMDAGLDDEINALLTTDSIYNRFVETFGQELYSSVIDTMGNTLQSFVNSSYDMSLNALQSNMNTNISSAISTTSNEIKKYIGAAISYESADIRQKVENIIKYYSSQGMNIETPQIQISDVSINGINTNSLIQDVAKQINTEGFGDYLVGATIGAVAASAILGILGPIGWIAGGAILLGNAIFGDSKEEKKAKAMAKALSRDERIKTYDAIVDKQDEIFRKVEQNIRTSLNNDNIRNCVKEISSGVLNSYAESLKKARILID
jgi:hypothetical protein